MDLGIIELIILIATQAVIVGVAYGKLCGKFKIVSVLLDKHKSEMQCYIQKELNRMEKRIDARIDKVEKDVVRHELILQAKTELSSRKEES
jgi:hypothetical protein